MYVSVVLSSPVHALLQVQVVLATLVNPNPTTINTCGRRAVNA